MTETPERCHLCGGSDPNEPARHGQQLYVCRDCGGSVCSGCSENSPEDINDVICDACLEPMDQLLAALLSRAGGWPHSIGAVAASVYVLPSGDRRVVSACSWCGMKYERIVPEPELEHLLALAEELVRDIRSVHFEVSRGPPSLAELASWGWFAT